MSSSAWTGGQTFNGERLRRQLSADLARVNFLHLRRQPS
jgi:hypothetical protein